MTEKTINIRALSLELLLEITEGKGYSHVVLRGALEKSDLLRMAESVKRRDLSIESSQPGRFEIISGTACEDPK